VWSLLKSGKTNLTYVGAAVLIAGVLVAATLVLVPASRSTTTITEVSVSATTQTITSIETATSTGATSSTSNSSTATSSSGAPFGALGKWNLTSDYPFTPIGPSCVASDERLYCVGGYAWVPHAGNVVNSTYYATLSPSGVGPWAASTAYPMPIMDESCVTDSGYIYCVGGIGDTVNQGCVSFGGGATCGNATNSVVSTYYASLTPKGISPWMPTTPYPTASDPQCTLAFVYILCVGTTGYSAGVTYFASLSDQGIGNWTRSYALPPTMTGCVTTNSYAYCFEGSPCTSGDCANSTTYYAPLLDSGGTGPWVATSSIPSSSFTAYTQVALGPYVYLMTDPPEFATSIPNGLGAWTQTGSEPSDDPQSCVSSGTYIYCVGGWLESHGTIEVAWTNDVYFYQVEPIG